MSLYRLPEWESTVIGCITVGFRGNSCNNTHGSLERTLPMLVSLGLQGKETQETEGQIHVNIHEVSYIRGLCNTPLVISSSIHVCNDSVIRFLDSNR